MCPLFFLEPGLQDLLRSDTEGKETMLPANQSLMIHQVHSLFDFATFRFLKKRTSK